MRVLFCCFFLALSAGYSSLTLANELPKNFASLPVDVQALLLEYAYFNDSVTEKWGQDANFASETAYVKYLDDYLSRAQIDFEKGQLIVETQAASEPKLQLKNAIVSAILTPDDANKVDLFSAREITPGGKPFLLGQVKDQHGKNIQYTWRAQQYAQHLIDTQLQILESPQGLTYKVDIPLSKNHKKVAAKGVYAYVEEASDRFNLPASLILGIIETESSFNPYAVSHANAYGLMQIIPRTAGADVFKLIFKKTGKPSRQYLFNSRNNILTGSAYLKILRDRYLSKIQHPTSQLYCIISAYNGGFGNVFKTFHSSRKKAIERINALSVEDVLWRLRKKQPSLEARRYLEKVLANQQKHEA